MAAGDSATLSGSLAGIVNDIRTKSFRYILRDGVCQNLVTPLGKGAKGDSVTIPVLDPTAITGTAATEGTDITTFKSMTSTTREYTATEWAVPTFITYNVVEDGSEDIRAFQAEAHGSAHALKVEQKIVACFASFTTNTITATGGLTWAKIQAGGVKLRGPYKNAPEPYSLVISDNAWYWFTAGVVGNANYAPTPLSDSVLSSYHLGTVTGINIFRTHALSATSSQKCGMFSKAAIGLFVPRDYTFKTQEDISRRGYELISTMRHGARVHVEPYGVCYTAKGTAPS